jgi:Outer membrane protein beta-barrel domain
MNASVTISGRTALLALVLALTVLPGLAGPASAQTRAGDFELGFAVGGLRFDDQVSDEDELYAALRGGYSMTDAVALEVQAGRASSILDSELTLLFVNGVFQLRPAAAVSPYLLAGVGGARLEQGGFLGSPEIDEEGLAYQAALGARFALGSSRRMVARLEIGTIFEETLEDTNQHLFLTGGLTWRLGGN